ncbi:MAG: peptide deformylase [Firmicutes bacterium]|nr:peptide deformylase [Bacillota bacterium]
MAIRLLRTVGDPILRKQAMEVKRFDATLERLLDDMAESMYYYEGVGLAAPQIGISKQIVVIDADESGLLELVNPEIVASEGEELDIEGCLSVPKTYGEVKRASKVKVVAQDRFGERIEIEAEGLLARALQHEIDHLHGILYIDKAERILPPEDEIDEEMEE